MSGRGIVEGAGRAQPDPAACARPSTRGRRSLPGALRGTPAEGGVEETACGFRPGGKLSPALATGASLGGARPGLLGIF